MYFPISGEHLVPFASAMAQFNALLLTPGLLIPMHFSTNVDNSLLISSGTFLLRNVLKASNTFSSTPGLLSVRYFGHFSLTSIRPASVADYNSASNSWNALARVAHDFDTSLKLSG